MVLQELKDQKVHLDQLDYQDHEELQD